MTSVGAYRHAQDPRAKILLASVSEDAPDAPVYLWVHPDHETADLVSDPEALEILRRAELVYAHNAPYECAVSDALAQATFGFGISIDKWRCTAAMARRAGLPHSLDLLTQALGGDVAKDPRGKKLIKLFCQPQEDGRFADPKDHPEEWFQFGEYCKQDTRAEKFAHQKLKPFELTGALLETFLFDLRMNHRGIPVNVPALINAQRIIEDVERTVVARFRALTGLNPSQREAVRTLVGLPNMQADTVGDALANRMAPLTAEHREILGLYQKVSYAATKKIRTMLDCVCSDGRVRGMFMFYGAGTGRWTAGLMQPQNFKRTPKWMRPILDKTYELICRGVPASDLDLIADPHELIAGCIRLFIHEVGVEVLDGDYAAVEARIICWLAGQWDILEMWKQGKDLYRYMASVAYNVPETTIDSDGRDFGKRIELGCGFGLGPEKFQSTCEQYDVKCDQALAERGVKVYRTTHREVVKYWYLLDGNARRAIKNPGQTFGAFTVRKISNIPFLLFRLRSGRSLSYPHPEIRRRPPTLKEREQMAKGHEYQADRFEEVTYWGEISRGVWGRIKLYGGKLAENETQATAADFMAHGAIQAEKRGMEVFMLVHDQGLALRNHGQTPEEYGAALADLPAWATGMPLKVDAKIAPYYRK